MAIGGWVISRNSPSTRKAHAVVEFVGLEVQVGRAQVDRVDQHLLQEAHRPARLRQSDATLPASASTLTFFGDVELKSPMGHLLERFVSRWALVLEHLRELVVLDA
jgi:hypothetical protein